MIEAFLWRVAQKVGPMVFVCLYKHFATWSTNGWADRDWGGTIRRAGTAEGQWCQSLSDWWHVARGTCHVPMCQPSQKKM